VKITAIATGFGDRFDLEKSKPELKSVASQQLGEEVNRDIPAFKRIERQTRDVPKQRAFFVDEEDQYDIPTFLRKSVD
jgi:cell division protein FtsZ